MTGVFETQDEQQASRVLAALENQGLDPEFRYKDGQYEIFVPGDFGKKHSSELQRFARTIANTNLKAAGLGGFKQCP